MLTHTCSSERKDCVRSKRSSDKTAVVGDLWTQARHRAQAEHMRTNRVQAGPEVTDPDRPARRVPSGCQPGTSSSCSTRRSPSQGSVRCQGMHAGPGALCLNCSHSTQTLRQHSVCNRGVPLGPSGAGRCAGRLEWGFKRILPEKSRPRNLKRTTPDATCWPPASTRYEETIDASSPALDPRPSSVNAEARL